MANYGHSQYQLSPYNPEGYGYHRVDGRTEASTSHSSLGPYYFISNGNRNYEHPHRGRDRRSHDYEDETHHNGKAPRNNNNQELDDYRPQKRRRYEKTDHRSRSLSRHQSRSRSRERSCEFDDEEGHYIIRLGEALGHDERYKMLSIIGEGTFGQVVECWDRRLKDYYAVKIIRSVPKYRDAAMIEIEILEYLNKFTTFDDPVIRLASWFDFRNHVCMVFVKYGPSLYDFLKRNHYHPFTVDEVRDIGFQLTAAVAFMHKLGLVHTDLKPENVLFRSSRYFVEEVRDDTGRADSRSPSPTSTSHNREVRRPQSLRVKLIDFGSATFDDEYHTRIVSTRHYRSIEVILGLGWSFPTDLWSIGCILFELYTGDALFQTHHNHEHLAMMERVLGEIPPAMVLRATNAKARKYFTSEGKLIWPGHDTSASSIRHVSRLKPLAEYFRRSDRELYELVRRLLAYNPRDRLTALDALDHPFFAAVSHERRTAIMRFVNQPGLREANEDRQRRKREKERERRRDDRKRKRSKTASRERSHSPSSRR